MATIKIAHVADSHLRQRQYGNYDRGKEFVKGLISAIKAAHSHGCAAILHSGDLVDSINPGSCVCLDQLDEVQKTLVECKLPMFVISGNHDKTDPNWCSRFNSSYASTKTGMVVIDNTTITIPGTTIKIHGLPFMPDNEIHNAVKNAPAADIIMWHGAVKEFAGFSTANAMEASEFDIGKWSLAALGDLHIHKYMRMPGGTIVAYPGSTELCSSSEDAEKKVMVYTFEKPDGKRKWSCTAVDSVSFATRPVQVVEINTEDELVKFSKNITKGALVFVKYAREITNALLRLRNMMPEDALLRATPVTSVFTKKAGNIQVVQGQTMEQFLDAHLSELTSSEDIANNIRDLCKTILNPKMDHKAALEEYCK